MNGQIIAWFIIIAAVIVTLTVVGAGIYWWAF